MKLPLTKPDDSHRKLWEIIVSFVRKNHIQIILAAGLAILVQWVIREQLPTETKSVRFKIEVKHRGNEVELGTPTPEYVTAEISGNKLQLERFTGEYKIKLDTELAKRTKNSNGETLCVWNLTPKMVNVPLRIKVDRISPSQVQLVVDTFSTKKLPVRPILNNFELPKGFKIGKVSVDPEQIFVTAPSTKLDVIPEIRTEPISLKNITHSFDCDQKLVGSENVDFDRKNVLVQVEILPATKTKVMKTLPVRILIPPSSRLQTLSCEIVSAPTVDLEVSGEEGMIENLEKEDVFIFADISEFTKPGLYWIDLRCAIGKNGVSSFKIKPQKVNVKLEQINRR